MAGRIKASLHQLTIQNDLINKAILQELIDAERVKIKLYKENHRLYNDNKFLKRQINSKKESKASLKIQILINTFYI